MNGENFAGNIIVNLANLPDFLRIPILKKRMLEFFSLSEQEKQEMIHNALEAGPTIPFSNFSKLFKTWLEILSNLTEEQRRELFGQYISKITNSPQMLVAFNLDGVFEIFLSLHKQQQDVLITTIRSIIEQKSIEQKRKLFVIMPDNVKKHFGL